MSTYEGVVVSMHGLRPAEAGKYIAERSEHVKVIKDKCKDVAELIMDDLVDGKIGDIEYTANPLHPSGINENYHLNWVFFLDTLNFSFWPEDGELYEVTYNGKKEVGYLAMCAAFMKAHDAGLEIFEANFVMSLTLEQLDKLLISDSGHSIPMVSERWRVMQEAAKHLLDKFEGLYMKMVLDHSDTAQDLLKAIVYIESFRDESVYKGQKVYILKRAQILVADTWGVLKHSKLNHWVDSWTDLDTITMFADYRVPQVLSYFGCLEYSEKLREELLKNTLFKYGSEMEVEIRGTSIYSVIYEEIKRLREAGYREVNYEEKRKLLPIDIDIWLWQYRRENSVDVESLTPMHRTRSIHY